MFTELSWLQFIILAFASFRFTHLLVYDDISIPLRRHFIEPSAQKDEQGQVITVFEPLGTGIRRFIGLILLCHWCTGIWSALFLTALVLFVPGAWWLLIILAAAGVAAIIETIVLRL
ncbi:DUF1360 domain-containing protein [Paenibacillus sp. UMB4589-SE434]|uniref:DUF1360 domain-containing protein n=1 Tax=Paenibacillus sp. UMB4589-SE434 TaxID=3046314 RepID=UPI00254C6CA3|nr:DUF1360 domain-containing protein [Paenibacillus sp. UMB4589-SE434]MDK8182835.1 DUF1360 domain-containing protein [Paenibacillus sp. UMB4589-SE434]